MDKKKKFKRYIVTAALPYANGPIHIGHIAGNFLPADIYARYLRLKGKDVIFISGSDEHGVPITLKARQNNVSPQDIVDKYHELNKKDLVDFGISFDIFSRTSNYVHKKNAEDFFSDLNNKGLLESKETEQYYDEEAKQFLADRYIIGTCPKCSYNNAYGDQCEKCGTSLSPNELIDPHSSISGNKPILKKTKHWYLPIDKYENWLKKWILEEHEDWKVNVIGQCKSWIKDGLRPRAITRDLTWGVKVPLKEAEGKVLYVWFDAPIGYISFTKELLGEKWKDYWLSEDTKLVNFIGKDNIVFHCIMFPIMLKMHGDFILPDQIPANEFMNLEGEKISTSRNHAVWLHDFLDKFKGKQDVLRYVICANMPENKDSDFTWEDFKNRNNNELVATFGNFVNRTIVMINKNFNNRVPEMKVSDESIAILKKCDEFIESICQNIENFKFKNALQDLMEIARIGNKYISDKEPWRKIKTDKEEAASILGVAIQIIAKISVCGEPFMPFTSKKIRDMLSITSCILETVLNNNNIVKENTEIKENQLLFEKL